ncbi:succinate-semialdehyde dehydrogenase / glutarate-semialdehyde dehydrogenase [Geodermatophilus saharensis]|uniref:Succinate-semialdehyde dehydrogenase / glutarate-semialdehyde dehydrogenase n=1 Tax=Geodermatophilus saharensis TaxID=1137994 RepID=A0A239A8K5_9ACTN|nr:NAD-dependent succinate-semialdehyde dehydrogenase [Geodermatophilus saharensis]SNR91772.1 succinate-semialdehyde dehydrogenase / glutarate-semialdehyde dehydrogenase [Geodermatophilus saharensis]
MTQEPAHTIHVDGEWRAAEGGATFPVTDPATGEVIGRASDGDRADTAAAIAAAERALPAWSGATAYERAAVLARADALMRERRRDLAALMTREQGKPLKAAMNEVAYAADFLAWFAEEAKRVGGVTIPSARADQRFVTMRQAVGVVAAITPWNYPISMLTRKLAPAVAAGCTSVLKPAEQTPLCAVATVQLLVDAGLPAGVVNLVTTSRPAEVGDELLDSPVVRKLTFTGSTAVGKVLVARAGATLKRVSVELGGHAPFIVFGDADPVRAAKGAALVKFLNTGQACISPNRIYVHRSLYDTFVATLEQRIAALRVGRGDQEGISIGPLIDERAVAKMAAQVDDARTRGARVVAGGERLQVEGLGGTTFFSPTLLADVTPDMLVSREETFGPIAAVTPFDDEDEVVARANDTEYGLAAYVYTNDLSTAIRVTEKLRFGMVGVNDINPTSAAAPFGGVKASGLGREGGYEGIDEYLDTKLVGIAT